MVFSSLVFMCAFLPVTFGLSLVMPNVRAKNVLLVLASLTFYAYGEPVYVVLLIATSLADYLFAKAVLPGRGTDGRRRAALVCAVVVNLSSLGVFKYAGMLVGSVNSVTGAHIPVPEIALPIGISFYTFQALSYVIDVYRGDAEPARNYGELLLYIAFFPQLIAGPIVKYHDIADQIRDRVQTPEKTAFGLRRFCFGLAKKVLLANQFAVVADALFNAPADSLFFASAWLAALAYALQIYFDFSAYSDMAIGLGAMFGFKIKENFNYPYVSTSIKEFWRRWHISLSTWFKEYLYIPLGGNRKGRARAAFNRMTVFFLCGLWHGASWTFVAWGLYHGLFLLLEEYVPVIRKMPRALGHAYVMVVVLVSWVLFRADSFSQAFSMITVMFTVAAPTFVQMQLLVQQVTPLTVTAAAVGLAFSLPIKPWLQNRLKADERPVLLVLTFALAAVLLVACLLELSSSGYNPFIYFRF